MYEPRKKSPQLPYIITGYFLEISIIGWYPWSGTVVVLGNRLGYTAACHLEGHILYHMADTSFP